MPVRCTPHSWSRWPACAMQPSRSRPSPRSPDMAVTIRDLQAAKREGRRFVMLTAYDFPTARLLAEAEIPVILVGDSVGDNVLGYANTLQVTMTEILNHVLAVARACAGLLA